MKTDLNYVLLMGALRTGDDEQMRACLRDGADPCALYGDGKVERPFIHIVAAEGSMVSIMTCIELGAEVNCTAPDGETVLTAAIKGNKLANASALLLSGADVNMQKTPDVSATNLYTAVSEDLRAGQVSRTRLLIDHGADPKQVMVFGEGARGTVRDYLATYEEDPERGMIAHALRLMLKNAGGIDEIPPPPPEAPRPEDAIARVKAEFARQQKADTGKFRIGK